MLTNTILWNNQADTSGDQIYNEPGSTPTIAYSDIQDSGGSGAGWDTALGTDGGNNLDADPLFVTPVDPSTAPTTAGDLHLQAGSQAIDAGDNDECPASDLDGNLRPIDGDGDDSEICDMGAYEYGADPSLTGLIPDSATAGSSAFTLTVNGSNFVSGATVRWAGSGRPTTFVNSAQLTAEISQADIATAGTVTVTVANPGSGDGESNGLTFTVDPAPTATPSATPTPTPYKLFLPLVTN